MPCDVLDKPDLTVLLTGLSACLLRRRYLTQQRWWQSQHSSRMPDATQHDDAPLVSALKALPIFELARHHQAPASETRLSQQQTGSFDSLLHQEMPPATGTAQGFVQAAISALGISCKQAARSSTCQCPSRRTAAGACMHVFSNSPIRVMSVQIAHDPSSERTPSARFIDLIGSRFLPPAGLRLMKVR